MATPAKKIRGGALTREQFLLPEMRIVASLRQQGVDDASIVDRVKSENLFQYPTERMLSNRAGVCLKRLDALVPNEAECAQRGVDQKAAAQAVQAITELIATGTPTRGPRCIFHALPGGARRCCQMGRFHNCAHQEHGDGMPAPGGPARPALRRSASCLFGPRSARCHRSSGRCRRHPGLYRAGDVAMAINRRTQEERAREDLEHRCQVFRERLAQPDFLANKGIGNEIGFYTFCYDPSLEFVYPSVPTRSTTHSSRTTREATCAFLTSLALLSGPQGPRVHPKPRLRLLLPPRRRDLQADPRRPP